MDYKAIVWPEKYRPSVLEDVVLPEGDRNIIINSIKDPKAIPNFMFYSSKAGTGKTSLAFVISKILECDTKILNASDDRGIDIIREQVKGFASTLAFDRNIKRCIILNEADGLTSAAQNTLRDVMEAYSNNVFFILTANKEDKVIDPIRSRCISINFNNPPKEEIYKRIKYISKQEKLEIVEPDIENLVNILYPDMRRMVLALQKVSLGQKLEDLLGEESQFINILNATKEGKYDWIIKEVKEERVNVMNFINWCFDFIVISNLTFEKKGIICKNLALMEKLINDNVDSKIVFLGYLTEIRKGLI